MVSSARKGRNVDGFEYRMSLGSGQSFKKPNNTSSDDVTNEASSVVDGITGPGS